MYDNLTDENFLLYAAKNYNNPSCYDTLEFYDDLKNIIYKDIITKKLQDC